MIQTTVEKVKNYVFRFEFLDNPYIAVPLGLLITLICIFGIVTLKTFILIKGLEWLFSYELTFWKGFFTVILLTLVSSNSITFNSDRD